MLNEMLNELKQSEIERTLRDPEHRNIICTYMDLEVRRIDDAGKSINTNVHPHTLRPSFANHLLEF